MSPLLQVIVGFGGAIYFNSIGLLTPFMVVLMFYCIVIHPSGWVNQLYTALQEDRKEREKNKRFKK